jgi:hypothetical protein
VAASVAMPSPVESYANRNEIRFLCIVRAKANALAARIDEPTLPLFKRVLRFLKLREPLAQLLFAFGVSSDIHFLVSPLFCV